MNLSGAQSKRHEIYVSTDVETDGPMGWFDPHRHTQVALDDAIEQGALFCNMLASKHLAPG